MILLIDNYDSFAYNLYQMLGSLRPDIEVLRNDRRTAEEIGALSPEAIILSPGPGRPADAGVCEEVVRTLGDRIPILGVCLGHQAICEAYGGTVGYAARLMHGKQSLARVVAASSPAHRSLFEGLPEQFPVARYHSLALLRETLPAALEITAVAEDGEVMAVRHRQYPVYGLQFHPESILTPDGAKILENFLKIREPFSEEAAS